MAEISASTVMKLRKMSGQGMMDCKKALNEADGDLDQALDILRKKGMATMAKRAGRETSEGRVVCKSWDNGKTAAMAALCCETDFVSKSDDFVAASEKMLEYMEQCPADEGAQALADTEVGGKKFSEVITDMVSKTGEKSEVGDYCRYKVDGEGTVGSYIHFNNKIGAMVEVEASSAEVSEAVKNVAVDICMHISAMNPLALDRDSVDSATIEAERKAAAEQVQNKPPEIIEKIVDGKMNKFFGERCLADQAFVKDDSVTVSAALEKAARDAGGTAKMKRFFRIAVGD